MAGRGAYPRINCQPPQRAITPNGGEDRTDCPPYSRDLPTASPLLCMLDYRQTLYLSTYLSLPGIPKKSSTEIMGVSQSRPSEDLVAEKLTERLRAMQLQRELNEKDYILIAGESGISEHALDFDMLRDLTTD